MTYREPDKDRLIIHWGLNARSGYFSFSYLHVVRFVFSDSLVLFAGMTLFTNLIGHSVTVCKSNGKYISAKKKNVPQSKCVYHNHFSKKYTSKASHVIGLKLSKNITAGAILLYVRLPDPCVPQKKSKTFSLPSTSISLMKILHLMSSRSIDFCKLWSKYYLQPIRIVLSLA